MTYKYGPFWQQHIRETVRHALNVHPRLTALWVDLRPPGVLATTDAAVISHLINALKARIDAYQKRKHREGKRVYPTILHYIWAREFGEYKDKKHCHLMLLASRDTRCRTGDYRAPESLAGMIKQAGCSALGVDVGCHATLMHFPAGSAVWLARNDDTGFQQVLERADYLAKEYTKAHYTDECNFGCSRSGARLARQYPANQKYGLLSDDNDIPTRPLTVFYISVPLCDNHSAVTTTSLLYPNSNPDFNGTVIHTLTMPSVPGRLLPACHLTAEVYNYIRKVLYRP